MASADSVARALSPLPGTLSPGSSSTSTNSGSGSGEICCSLTITPNTQWKLNFYLILGTDTVKRGASPATSITNSMSSVRLKESGSTYSIKQNSTMDAMLTNTKDGIMKDNTSTLDRTQKIINNSYGPISSSILPSRSVLFSSDLGTSLSSQSIKDQLKSSHQQQHQTSNLSTSSAIKQTLSPLSQHRNAAAAAAASLHQSSGGPSEPNNVLKNQTSSSSSLGTYQFPSSSINLKNASSSLNNENYTSSSMSPSSIRKSMSPSRSISNTNTLPSSVARNMLYQSESSYSLKSSTQNPTAPTNHLHSVTTNFTSPGNHLSSTPASASSSSHHHNMTSQQQSNSMNLYGTLPKTSAYSLQNNTSGPISGGGGSVGGGNDFEMMSAGGGSGRNASSAITVSNGGYNTLGSYRVQYSSTNPFLPSFNPASNGAGSDATLSHGDKYCE